MRPQRLLADIKRDSLRVEEDIRTFDIRDDVDRLHALRQRRNIDDFFGPSSLISRLRFRHAIFNRLDPIATSPEVSGIK